MNRQLKMNIHFVIKRDSLCLLEYNIRGNNEYHII